MAMERPHLKVMVLAGGPDRERQVSLQSAAQVTEALRRAGHDTQQHDILPTNLTALDAFEAWGGDAIFPVMHGGWGEGGALQAILDERGIPYVGCRADAADLAMDKHLAKEALRAHGLPTPDWQLLQRGQRLMIGPPLVLKPLREGSSIDTVICRSTREARNARTRLSRRHDRVLAEAYVNGWELTVGTLEVDKGPVALPPIRIVPATGFYDYDAKYIRDDTSYDFDIDLPADVLVRVRNLAVATHHVLGCRHMSRVDFIVDAAHSPWILELNTIPGFTTHSLLPMAAARAGMPLPRLVDHLARLAAGFDTAPSGGPVDPSHVPGPRISIRIPDAPQAAPAH